MRRETERDREGARRIKNIGTEQKQSNLIKQQIEIWTSFLPFSFWFFLVCIPFQCSQAHSHTQQQCNLHCITNTTSNMPNKCTQECNRLKNPFIAFYVVSDYFCPTQIEYIKGSGLWRIFSTSSASNQHVICVPV